jgi:hypothetical protein
MLRAGLLARPRNLILTHFGPVEKAAKSPAAMGLPGQIQYRSDQYRSL